MVVTEKATNMIDTFVVTSGVASAVHAQASAGVTPFGFAFSRAGQLVVSEATGGSANASTISSYSVASDGTITPITSTLATSQTAACWLTVAGDWAYAANTGSANVSSLGVTSAGDVSLLSGNAASSGAGSIDVAATPDNGFLYALASGPHTISILSIQADGSLAPEPALTNAPLHAAGLVAR
ncbi:MAG: hypothetical protein ACREJX_05815 [Polyangiaceae bacterium]